MAEITGCERAGFAHAASGVLGGRRSAPSNDEAQREKPTVARMARESRRSPASAVKPSRALGVGLQRRPSVTAAARSLPMATGCEERDSLTRASGAGSGGRDAGPLLIQWISCRVTRRRRLRRAWWIRSSPASSRAARARVARALAPRTGARHRSSGDACRRQSVHPTTVVVPGILGQRAASAPTGSRAWLNMGNAFGYHDLALPLKGAVVRESRQACPPGPPGHLRRAALASSASPSMPI
jgi:hypothetical protein